MGAFFSRPMKPLQQNKVDMALVKMTATDFQPFSVVDGTGRSTVSRQLLPNLFEKVRIDLLEKI